MGFGLFLIFYAYNKTTPEERDLILKHIKEADLFWVGLSLFIGVLSHVSRAIRWNHLLRPIGYNPPIKTNILVILMGYFANLGIPRSGELLRATALTTYEKVPFQQSFGTIVTERIIDLMMLALIVGLTLVLQTEVILNYFIEQGIDLQAMLLVFLAFLLLGFMGLLFVKKSNLPVVLKFRGFFSGLIEGALSILKLKNKWAFIGHTLFIWTAYFLMFWVVKYTIPETTTLTFSQLLVPFVAGAFAMSATNGGIGLYPIAVQKTLSIFGITVVSGNAYGWIMWISQTVLVVVLGALSFILVPFVSSKNK